MKKVILSTIGIVLALSAFAPANAACVTGRWNTASEGRTKYYTLYNSCVGRQNVRYCTGSGFCDSITLDTGDTSGWIAINQSTTVNWCECKAPGSPSMKSGSCYC
jgi:hypothetical protein